MMWVRQCPHFSSISSTWEPYSATFQAFSCQPHFLTETTIVFDERTNVPNSEFSPIQVLIKLLRIVFPIAIQLMDDHINFVQEVPRDLQFCRGHSIVSNLGASSNFTKVHADTASAACPSQPGNLAMTSTTFAAVIWDGDEPCSAYAA